MAAHRSLPRGGEEAPHRRSGAHVRRRRQRAARVEHGRRVLVLAESAHVLVVRVAEEAGVVPDRRRRARRPGTRDDELGGRGEAGGAVGGRDVGAALRDAVHGPVLGGDVRGHVVGHVRDAAVGAGTHGGEEPGDGDLAARRDDGRGVAGAEGQGGMLTTGVVGRRRRTRRGGQ